MSYYLYIHNIYLYQYHDTKPNPINIDRLLGLTPTIDVIITLTVFLNAEDLTRPSIFATSDMFHLTKALRKES